MKYEDECGCPYTFYVSSFPPSTGVLGSANKQWDFPVLNVTVVVLSLIHAYEIIFYLWVILTIIPIPKMPFYFSLFQNICKCNLQFPWTLGLIFLAADFTVVTVVSHFFLLISSSSSSILIGVSFTFHVAVAIFSKSAANASMLVISTDTSIQFFPYINRPKTVKEDDDDN